MKSSSKISKKKPDALKWAEKLKARTEKPDFAEWFFDADQIDKDFRLQLNADNFIADAIIRRLFKKYPLHLTADSKQKEEVCFTCLEDIQNYLSKKYLGKTADELRVPLIYNSQFTEEHLIEFCNQLIQTNQDAIGDTNDSFLTSMFNQLAKSERNAFLRLLKGSLLVRRRLASGISKIEMDQVLREFYLSLASAWVMLNDAEKTKIMQELNDCLLEIDILKPLSGQRGKKPTISDEDIQKLADILMEHLKRKSIEGIVDEKLLDKWTDQDNDELSQTSRVGFRNVCIHEWNNNYLYLKYLHKNRNGQEKTLTIKDPQTQRDKFNEAVEKVRQILYKNT